MYIQHSKMVNGRVVLLETVGPLAKLLAQTGDQVAVFETEEGVTGALPSFEFFACFREATADERPEEAAPKLNLSDRRDLAERSELEPIREEAPVSLADAAIAASATAAVPASSRRSTTSS